MAAYLPVWRVLGLSLRLHTCWKLARAVPLQLSISDRWVWLSLFLAIMGLLPNERSRLSKRWTKGDGRSDDAPRKSGQDFWKGNLLFMYAT